MDTLKKTVLAYTGGRGDIWVLAGNQKRSCRKHILEVALGRKCKSTEIGITNLRDTLYSLANANEGASCGAMAEKNFMNWLRN